MGDLSTLLQDEPLPGIFRLSGLTEIHGLPARFNSYLLRHQDPQTDIQWTWIDPGPAPVFDTLVARVGSLVGDWSRLRLVVASCLEAESVANLPAVLEKAPSASALMTLETWGFLEMMDVPVDRVLLANHFREGLRLGPRGPAFRVILNPYQQFSGAFLIQETSTGALFSGGLLANCQSLNSQATDADWDPMAEHACRQLPCQEALRWSVARIRALRQPAAAILPLWGPAVTRDRVGSFLDLLEKLPVGADLLSLSDPAADSTIEVS